MSNKKYLGNSVTIFRLAKITAVSGECCWRHLYFIDEHTSRPLEENNQAHDMNVLMPYEGTESIGKTQSLRRH